MSTILPMEYVVLQKKMAMNLYKEVSEHIVGLFIMGSAAGHPVFPGVSDINFLLILKDLNNEEGISIINKVSTVVKDLKMDTMFTTLIDLEIIFSSNAGLDNELNKSIISPLKLQALKNGYKYDPVSKKYNNDNNPFAELKITQEELKVDARKLIFDKFNEIIISMTHPDIIDDDTVENAIFVRDLCIEGVLLATQAYFICKTKKFISKVDLSQEIEENESKSFNGEFFEICAIKRQGADYVSAHPESEDSEEQVPQKKKTGILYEEKSLGSDSIKYLIEILGLIEKL